MKENTMNTIVLDTMGQTKGNGILKEVATRLLPARVGKFAGNFKMIGYTPEQRMFLKSLYMRTDVSTVTIKTAF